MAGYVGNVPVPQSVREDQSFTATAGQTTFNTLGYTDGNRIKVTLNGVLLEGGGVDYTATNGSDVVLTVAAVVDDIVRFETFNEVQLVSNTSTTPIIKTNLTLKNDTHEDTDGGRESTVIFSGEQSGGEISTLAEIEASHDGTADDQKGDLIFRTNDGSDGTSPTERARIDAQGNFAIGTTDTASSTSQKNIFLGGTGNIYADSVTSADASLAISQNAKVDADNSWEYIVTDEATNYYQNAGNHVFRRAASGTAGNDITWAEIARINQYGLTFNGDTAAANALDDYETGSFQMTMTGISTTSAVGHGIYIKIGNMVHFQWYSGSVTITSQVVPVLGGLPFNATSPFGSGGAYPTAYFSHNTWVTNAATGYINLNSGSIYPTALGSTGGSSMGSTGSGKYCMCSGSYHAA